LLGAERVLSYHDRTTVVAVVPGLVPGLVPLFGPLLVRVLVLPPALLPHLNDLPVLLLQAQALFLQLQKHLCTDLL